MKNVYFYGCSYTAGDELADYIYYPELLECKTPEEYYKRKLYVQDTTYVREEYNQTNRELAYPNLISKKMPEEYNVKSFARNGKSYEENIIDIIDHITLKQIPDAVVLQVGPVVREILVLPNKILTLRYGTPIKRMSFEAELLNGTGVKESDVQNFMNYKILSDRQSIDSLHKFLTKIFLIKNIIESKDKFFLLIIPKIVMVQIKNLSEIHSHGFLKKIADELLATSYIPDNNKEIKISQGGHWDNNSHGIISDFILDKLNNHFHK